MISISVDAITKNLIDNYILGYMTSISWQIENWIQASMRANSDAVDKGGQPVSPHIETIQTRLAQH